MNFCNEALKCKVVGTLLHKIMSTPMANVNLQVRYMSNQNWLPLVASVGREFPYLIVSILSSKY